MERTVLARELVRVETPYGAVTVKRAMLPGGGLRATPEYEDCVRCAEESGAPLREVMRAALRGAEAGC